MILEITLVAISVLGLGTSLRALRLARMACKGGECPVVFTTRYARLLGVPNAWPALVYFVAVAGLGLDRVIRGPMMPLWPFLAASAASMAATAYLGNALIFRLRSG